MQRDSIGESWVFLCKPLSVGDSFLARHGSSCSLRPLSTETPPGLDMCRPCAGCLSKLTESSYVHQSCRVWKTLLPRCHPSPLALTIFPPPLPHPSDPSGKRSLLSFPLNLILLQNTEHLNGVRIWYHALTMVTGPTHFGVCPQFICICPCPLCHCLSIWYSLKGWGTLLGHTPRRQSWLCPSKLSSCSHHPVSTLQWHTRTLPLSFPLKVHEQHHVCGHGAICHIAHTLCPSLSCSPRSTWRGRDSEFRTIKHLLNLLMFFALSFEFDFDLTK